VLPAVAVAVLLVNLLAAGGIGFPGLSGSLWLLLALGLNTAQGDDRRPRTLPRTSAAAMLAVVLALAVACYASGYGPVLRCQGETRAAWTAWQQGDPDSAELHLRAAAEADPLAVEPWQQLASALLGRWQEERTPEALRRLRGLLGQYNEVLDRLAPNSSRAWVAAGDLHRETQAMAALSAAQRSDAGRRAVEAYSRAAELYPNSALCRAKLALAHQAAGDAEAFRRESACALRLDDQTPHADKKLPPEIRGQLSAPEPPG
jgi:tetratricopeptide (TPR) repeat protein